MGLLLDHQENCARAGEVVLFLCARFGPNQNCLARSSLDLKEDQLRTNRTTLYKVSLV